MKAILSVLAICTVVFLVGCETTQSSGSASPGAMGACPADCSKPCCPQKGACGADCSKPCCAKKGACGADCSKACCAGDAGKSCCGTCAGDAGKSCCGVCGGAGASMGAVSDAPSGCSSSSGCSGKVCPVTGTTK